MRPRAPDSTISLPTPPPPTGGSHLCSGTCSLRVQTPSQPSLPVEPQCLQVAHPVTSSLTTAIPHNQKDTVSGVLKKKSLARVLLSTSPVGQLQTSPHKLQGSQLAPPAFVKIRIGGFPGGAVVENLPANAGDTGSSPGLGRSHMPRSN